MIRTLLLVFALSPLVASAGYTTYSGTMCTNFKPTACGCNLSCGGGPVNGVQFIEAWYFDPSIPIYSATAPMTPNKLLVFFHGHGGTPGNNVDFLQLAATLGYDVIDLDYDYGRDYPSEPNPYPIDASCAYPHGSGPDKRGITEPTCGMSIDRVCGCFTDCYGQRNDQIAFGGGNQAGLPTTLSEWSVESRLAATITWMTTHANTQAERTRFQGYLSGSLPNWSAISVAAHSLGTSIAGYIGTKRPVQRVILLSGLCEKLFPDAVLGTVNWGSAFGCQTNTGTDESGQTYTFNGATCFPTTYGYRNTTSSGKCTLRMKPPAWMSGITAPNKYFFLQDTDDATCNWNASDGKRGQDQINNSTYFSGFTNIGDWQHPLGIGAGDWRGLLSETTTGAASQICGTSAPSGGHTAVISDDACDFQSFANANRNAAWQYLLTH